MRRKAHGRHTQAKPALQQRHGLRGGPAAAEAGSPHSAEQPRDAATRHSVARGPRPAPASPAWGGPMQGGGGAAGPSLGRVGSERWGSGWRWLAGAASPEKAAEPGESRGLVPLRLRRGSTIRTRPGACGGGRRRSKEPWQRLRWERTPGGRWSPFPAVSTRAAVGARDGAAGPPGGAASNESCLPRGKREPLQCCYPRCCSRLENCLRLVRNRCLERQSWKQLPRFFGAVALLTARPGSHWHWEAGATWTPGVHSPCVAPPKESYRCLEFPSHHDSDGK